jgi:phosphatidylinositol-bisphosphatase
LHYGRAELKQSDHRPVVSVIEIEAFMVDERKRDKIFTEVVQQLGPPDATIVLTCDDPAVFLEDETDEIILRELSLCGQVILVRHMGNEIRVTFSEGLGALAAVQLRTIQVGQPLVPRCGLPTNCKILNLCILFFQGWTSAY